VTGPTGFAVPSVTVTLTENSEVLPSGSVAVAEMNWPMGTAFAIAKT